MPSNSTHRDASNGGIDMSKRCDFDQFLTKKASIDRSLKLLINRRIDELDLFQHFHEILRNSLNFVLFDKRHEETWDIQNGENSGKTVVPRKVSKSGHFRQNCHFWHFRDFDRS